MYIIWMMTLMIAGACSAQLTCHLAVETAGHYPNVTATRVAGPPGKKGPRGPPGDVIRCDCTDVTDLRNRIEQLENVIGNLKAKASCGGLVHGTWCVRLLHTAGVAVTFPRASDLCAFYGGKLLDIESDIMFRRVYEYVQQSWNGYFQHPTRDYVHVWLASRYLNREIVLSNGSRLDPQSVGFWHKGHPPNDDSVNMGMSVATQPEHATTGHHGLTKFPATHSDLVPICQFAL